MKRYYFVLSVLVISASATYVLGQGCSDAGACSVPAFKPSIENIVSQKKNQFIIGLSAGAADHNIFVLTPQIGYSRKFGSWLSIDSRITGAWHSGNGISATGPGDVFLNLNFLFSSKFSITGGLKFPLSKANQYYSDEIVFPMDYQSSLGSLDMITGLAFEMNKWHFSLAYQQPLIQNENTFIPDNPFDPDSPFNEYPSTFHFERQGDILMHITRLISINDKITLMPGLLPIYHLGKDKYYSFDHFVFINGSAGLTLNATVYLIIQMGEYDELGINIGFPLIVRDVRPDGLTRSFVLGAEYSFNF